jgi:casein kinase I family protein HRR25
MHERNYIHQDVKPDNYRVTANGCVKILDFGLVNEYRTNGVHKGEGRFGLQGSPYFSSLNALGGFTLSRRDDIESLGYCIMFLIDYVFGLKSPWHFCGNFKDILKVKQEFIAMKEPFEGKYIGIHKFIKEASKMTYEEEPQYGML